jgi:hypothetical protein
VTTSELAPPLEIAGVPALPKSFGGYDMGPVRERPHFVKIMLYGKPGAGKTFLTAQAQYLPEMSPLLYMVPDAAELDTLRHAAPDATAMHIKSWQQFEDVGVEAAKLAAENRLPFRTAVIDTGTEAQKLSMRDIMADLLVKGRPGGGEVNPDVPSQREWGQSISQVRRLIRCWRDLPLNFIFVCHEAESKANNGINWIAPDLPGKLKNQSAGMFSNVLYLYVKQDIETEGRRKIVTDETRCLLTGLTEGFLAKSRTGAFPRVVVEPTMRQLYDGIVKADIKAREGGEQ